jgi:site-specific recombinase XerD
MNTPYFQSFLAPHLHQFVQYKRALNRKYLNDAHTLRLFDRYLCNHDIADWRAIDSAVVDDFLASRPKVGPKRYNLILYAVRRFFAFAIMQQWTQRNPVTASPRRITGSRIPYLFDLDTARRLMAEARKLPERSRAPYRGLVYETIFALLYGLGLRVGEVSRLKMSDADFMRNLLFIRETKFAKSRYVPMGPRLAQDARQLLNYQCSPSTPSVAASMKGQSALRFMPFCPSCNCISHRACRRRDSMTCATRLLLPRCFDGIGKASTLTAG